jgi:hypothetical protein
MMVRVVRKVVLLVLCGFSTIFLGVSAIQAETLYVCPDPASFKKTTWEGMLAFEGTNAIVAGKTIANCPGNNDTDAGCKTVNSAPKPPKALVQAAYYTNAPLFLCYYDTALVVTQFKGEGCHFKKPDAKDPTRCTVGGLDACTLVCN